MTIISISISESADQIVSGIPKSISLSTNTPASIFYTLDGTTPTILSNIYISPIFLPTDILSVTLSLFATDGMNSSAIIVNKYSPNISEDRFPHSTVTNLNNSSLTNSLFPFGTNSPNPTFNYENPSNAGITVNNPLIPSLPSAFDGDGNPTTFTNQPLSEYPLIYSTTDFEGKETSGVGNLPAKVKLIGKNSPVEYTQEQSNKTDKIFNPKALVIYQDSTKESPDDPVHINRQFFSLENQESVRDGNLLFNTALDSPSTMGSFIKSHFNPRTNMITYYYYDNTVNRWIISTTPYQPKDPNIGALYNMVFPRQIDSAGVVFKWQLFMYRTLI